MMKTKLLPLLILFAQTTSGQIYFEGLYGDATSSQAIAPGGTVPFEDGYLTWAYSFGNYRPYLFRVDSEGNLTHELFMAESDTINRTAFNVVMDTDTTFVGLVSVRVLTQPSNVRGDFGLVKFRINGDVIWEHIYGVPDRREIPQRVIQTSDGGFAMVGQAMVGTGPSEHGAVYLIRTDAAGEQMWEQTYGGSQYDAGISLIQPPDGGFLLLGWTYSFGAGQRDFYLIKTDNLGNQQWQKTYGDANFDSGHGIIMLSDGNYLMGGYRNLNERRQGYLYKVDELGSVIWGNDYGDDTTTEEFHKILELPNGDIVAAGLYDPYGAAPQSDNGGLLVRISSEGDEIWRRVYQKNEFTDLFYSVLATDDGGGRTFSASAMAQVSNLCPWFLVGNWEK
jgi:hypothetical protein